MNEDIKKNGISEEHLDIVSGGSESDVRTHRGTCTRCGGESIKSVWKKTA